MARTLPTVLALVVLVSGVAALGHARPHADDERNGLTAAERATLWSRDVETATLNESVTPATTDADAGTLHQLATVTDITFRRPPATAATWTRADFDDFEPGNESTSVAPSHASLTDSWAIKDAHATVFGLQPSTVTHANGTTRRYIAPAGTGQGVVDYRLEVPANRTGPTRRESWRVVDHRVDEVRLLANGTTIARAEATQLPRFEYELDARGETTLTLAADINATVRHTVRTRQVSNGSRAPTGAAWRETTVTTRADSVTVRDSLPVTVYDPSIERQRARYPNGDTATALTSSQPVNDYALVGREATVRSIWRFYTARNADWDRLVRRTATGTTTVASTARPVVVHAVPARDVRTTPPDSTMTVTHVWGPTHESPAATLGQNVTVGVTETPYTRPAGIAVRLPGGNASTIRARGIVRGSQVTVPATDAPLRIRPSTLSARVVRSEDDEALLRLELRDATTGEPIALAGGDEASPANDTGEDVERGYIAVAGERVRTNESGIATVRLAQPGVYTARFHPAPWLAGAPSYAGDTATARWHPLTTVGGWVGFGGGVLVRLLPLAVALYAGRRLGAFLRDRRERRGWP